MRGGRVILSVRAICRGVLCHCQYVFAVARRAACPCPRHCSVFSPQMVFNCPPFRFCWGNPRAARATPAHIRISFPGLGSGRMTIACLAMYGISYMHGAGFDIRYIPPRSRSHGCARNPYGQVCDAHVRTCPGHLTSPVCLLTGRRRMSPRLYGMPQRLRPSLDGSNDTVGEALSSRTSAIYCTYSTYSVYHPQCTRCAPGVAMAISAAPNWASRLCR